VNYQPPRMGPQPWPRSAPASTSSFVQQYAGDALLPRRVYEQFSAREYARRYARCAPRCASTSSIASSCGRPSHWSFGGGMLWPERPLGMARLASYVLVPLDGEPTMIYSMAGTHAEAVRRPVEVAIKDVRHSRAGATPDVMSSAFASSS